MATRAPKRRRRTAEDARAAILDAAAETLRAEGPAAIRLQDVAAKVGVSHPTVLHHFGSRQGLIDAVFARARDATRQTLLDSLSDAPDLLNTRAVLEAVAARLDDGSARVMVQLALSGEGGGLDGLALEPLVDAIHDLRKARWNAKRVRAPSREDTRSVVLLAALALVSLSVLRGRGEDAEAKRFRGFLARLVHHHLDGEPTA